MDGTDRDSQDSAAALLWLVNGYQVSQALHVAATLGIADRLGDGPQSCEDLAAAAGAYAPAGTASQRPSTTSCCRPASLPGVGPHGRRRGGAANHWVETRLRWSAANLNTVYVTMLHPERTHAPSIRQELRAGQQRTTA